ncbi:MAG: hypothetical protein IJG15_06040 [Lachnospiraceae bacterium]|nr:hypothetical protein [Lachnospiraceae bacterium]
MNQKSRQNQNLKKEAGEGSNQRHTLYFVNIIFMSCLTILSLLVALIAIISLRAKGTRGFGKVYTEQQIENIRRDAAEDGEDELRLRIQSSLESGKSSTQVLRELFDDSIVVVFRGRYFFYQVSDKIEKTALGPGLLVYEDGEVSYRGESPSVEIRRGVLLTDRNGKVDWDRLADSGVAEVTLAAGTITESGFTADQQFERNRSNAVEKDLPYAICLEVSGPCGEEVMQEAMDTIRDQVREQEEKPDLVLRLRPREDFQADEKEKEVWTRMVRRFCEMLEDEEMTPVIGADPYTFAAKVDLEEVRQYERWLIDHDEAVTFPYSFGIWEYSSEAGMEGVPGNSIMYSRLDMKGRLDIR